jgi:hypothetical protein
LEGLKAVYSETRIQEYMQRDATLSFDQVRENDFFGMHSDAASFIQAAEFQIDYYLGVLHARFPKLL